MDWIGESSYDKYTHIIGGITMPMKQTGRKIYKSMQGKQVDMDLLRQRNELTPAVGNVRVNARGDELGTGGKIVRKREDVLKDYYQSNESSVPDESPLKQTKAPVQEETPVSSSTVAKRTTTRAQEKLAQTEEDWIEDEDGNFVKKGE